MKGALIFKNPRAKFFLEALPEDFIEVTRRFTIELLGKIAKYNNISTVKQIF